MRHALLLLFALGCTTVRAAGTPSTNEDWAVRCMRIPEREVHPETIPEDFERCLEAWRAWAKEQE